MPPATAVDMTPGGGVRLSARAVVIGCALLAAAALVSRLMDADQAITAALKVVTATLALATIPGVLMTLLWRPRPELSLLELVGFGIAVSFGVAQFLVIVAVLVHVSPTLVLGGLGVVLVPVGMRAARSSVRLLLTVDELVIVAVTAALAVPLYLQGSPFDAYEDQVLVAIMRRLSALGVPRLDNIYVGPDIINTYPFPGGLYFMALIARLGRAG